MPSSGFKSAPLGQDRLFKSVRQGAGRSLVHHKELLRRSTQPDWLWAGYRIDIVVMEVS